MRRGPPSSPGSAHRVPAGLPTRSRLALPVLLLFLAAASACTLVGVPPGAPAPAPGESEPGRTAAEPPEAGEPGGWRGGAEEAEPAEGVRPSGAEVRALWVVRTTLVHPDSVRAMVRRAERAGFNTLLVQVRGRGDAYYESTREPRAAALSDAPPGYDPLALVLREAHARGLEVHAWVNVHLVNGVGALPHEPDHLVRSHPGWLAVPRELARELRRTFPGDPAYARALLAWARENEDRVEGIFTSPAHPEVKEHVHEIVMELVEGYPLDGLHLDYVRYPSPDFDYSPVALERFRLWAASRLPAGRAAALDRRRARDPLAWPEALPEAWDDFRRAQITDVVRRTHHAVKGVRPGLTVSAAVRPDPDEARRHRFQDWAAWLDEGILDAAATMAYTESDALFRSWMDGAVRRTGPAEIWAGIGLYKTDVPGALRQVEMARRRGVGGVAVFSYDWAVKPAPGGPGAGRYLEALAREAFGGSVRGR